MREAGSRTPVGWTLKKRIVHHTRIDENGCWIWQLKPSTPGYGRITLMGKNYLAHRIAYEVYVATIPPGLDVCHKCDVPLCVNPAHLFLGTARDNLLDAVKKGRFRRGNTKLTEEQAPLRREEHEGHGDPA